jgi:hypothetical protein
MNTRTHAQWQTLFAEQSASGLSARQFCAQRGLCPRYFSVRRRQLSAGVTAAASTAFVPLRRQVPMEVETPAMVVRYGRSTLELRGVSPEWVSQLLAALA